MERNKREKSMGQCNSIINKIYFLRGGSVSSQHPVPCVGKSAVATATEQMCLHYVGPVTGVGVLYLAVPLPSQVPQDSWRCCELPNVLLINSLCFISQGQLLLLATVNHN